MKKPQAATVAVLALGLAISSGGSARAAETSAGERAFHSNGCPTCHSVPAAGIEAKVKTGPMRGPDLPGPIRGRDDAWVQDFMRQKAQTEGGKRHAKPFEGTDEELSQLIAWLKSFSADGS